MAIVTKTATVAGYGVCSAIGTAPFSKIQEGGPAGAYRVVDANGLGAKLKINGEAATSVFSKTSHSAGALDAILVAVNAAIGA